MLRRLGFCRYLVGVVIAYSALIPTPVSARNFGDQPLDSVINEAGQINRCEELTKHELAAMTLAPTWGESGAGDQGAPSPMAMSRGDNDLALHSFAETSSEKRAFWHPGIGMWALDDIGLGTYMTANQRIATSTAAHKAASEMKTIFCNASGNNEQRRAMAWAQWFTCDDGSCEDIYDEIYCVGSDRVCNITRNEGVRSWGGMGIRQCRYASDGVGGLFTCWYIDIVNAEGDTSYWKQEPKTGGSTISPLTFAFYVFEQTDPVPNRESRNWIRADTDYEGGGIRAKRSMGSSSRDGLDWTHPPDASKLCDHSFDRGEC